MEEKEYVQKFLQNVQSNQFDEIDEHLYYYYQGLNIGKEETKIEIALALFRHNIDLETIANVTQISLETLEQLV